MDINSVQGSAASTNTLSTTPPVENVQTHEQNLEASQTRLDEQANRDAQQAFEVNITQEARNRLAQETEEPRVENPEPTTETTARAPVPEPVREPPAQTTPPTQEPAQLVNIVA